MARTREFNEKLALDKATELFWQKGYANTSMRQLVAHTGVAHAGLYTAFGDKESLFARSLKQYETHIFTHLFGNLESSKAGLKDVQKLFRFIDKSDQDKYFSNGCFIINTAVEFGVNQHSTAIKTNKTKQKQLQQHTKIHDIVEKAMQRILQAFRNAFENAFHNNQLISSIDVNAVSAESFALYTSCFVLNRSPLKSDIKSNCIELFSTRLFQN